MNVNCVAKVFQGYRAALDMPAGSTLAPRAIPGRFSRFGRLPQGKVHRMFLFFPRLDTCPGYHGIQSAL